MVLFYSDTLRVLSVSPTYTTFCCCCCTSIPRFYIMPLTKCQIINFQQKHYHYFIGKFVFLEICEWLHKWYNKESEGESSVSSQNVVCVLGTPHADCRTKQGHSASTLAPDVQI